VLKATLTQAGHDAQLVAASLRRPVNPAMPKHPELVVPFVPDKRRYRVDIDTEQDQYRFEQTTGRKLYWPAQRAE
jgi:hypothetical protein